MLSRLAVKLNQLWGNSESNTEISTWFVLDYGFSGAQSEKRSTTGA